eukprot:8517039-Pyramimonas_sp.AAC.1
MEEDEGEERAAQGSFASRVACAWAWASASRRLGARGDQGGAREGTVGHACPRAGARFQCMRI